MNKVGALERRLGNAQSSFSPCDYKPIKTNPMERSRHEAPPLTDMTVGSPSHDLPYSSLFLPCHYFTYAAGTSTGG